MDREESKYTGMACLQRLTYSGVDYKLPKFVSKFWPDQLPLFMRISIGVCGPNDVDFTFAGDEMYLVTHVKTQTRVILKDRTGQLLSFPDDHSMRFCTLVNGVKDEKGKQLKTILEEHSMTADKLQLIPESDKSISFFTPDQEHSMEMDLYEWETSYEERYLVGNSVVSEKLFHTPFVIPIWMPISVDVATAIKEEPAEAFDRMMLSVQRIMRSLKNDTTPGNKEVMLFEGDINDYEEGAYDTIAPSIYGTFESIRPKKRPSRGQSNDYTDSEDDYEETNAHLCKDEPPPPIPDRKPINEKAKHRPKIYPPGVEPSKESKQAKKSKLKIPKPGWKKKHDNELSSPTGGQSPQPEGGEETKKKSTTLTKSLSNAINHLKGPTRILQKPRKQKSSDKNEVTSPSGESYTSQISTTSAQSASTDDACYEDEVFPEHEPGLIYDDVLDKEVTEENEGEYDDEYEMVPALKKEDIKQRDNYSYCNPESLSKNKGPDATNTSSQDTKRALQETPGSLSLKEEYLNRPLPRRPDSVVQETTSEKPSPKARKKPSENETNEPKPQQRHPPTAPKPNVKIRTAKPSASSTETKPHSTTVDTPQEHTEEPTYGSYKEIPETVRNMSVKQVIDCLRVMSLEHHIESFQRQDVDGELLQDFDEKMLIEDFNFNRFEAKKMMRFIGGWRPDN